MSTERLDSQADLVQVERIAREYQLRIEGRIASNLIGVILRLATVEDRRIEVVDDVFDQAWMLSNSGNRLDHLLAEGSVVLHEWRCEE